MAFNMSYKCVLSGNNIYYSGAITNEGVMELQCDVLDLDSEKRSKLYMHSGGGDVYAGLHLHDLLAQQDAEMFSIIVCGSVCSSATLGLFALPQVYMYSNATLLFHSISSTHDNVKHNDMVAYTAHIEELNKRINEIYNKKLSEVLDWGNKEIYLNAQQALDLGIVSKII